MRLLFFICIFILFTPFGFANNKLKGVTISAQMGYAQANPEVNDWQANTSKGNFVYGATLGYDFPLLKSVSVGGETGLFYGNDLSKYVQTNVGEYKVSNLIVPFLAKIAYQMPNHFDFFLKSGISYVDPSAVKSGNPTAIDWNSSWNFTLAGGIGYQYEKVNFFIQYLHIFGQGDVTVSGNSGTGYAADIDMITGGVMFAF